MGLGRMIWRMTGVGRTIDTAKNVVEEGSLVGGVKKTLKEDICEDNPLTGAVYRSGKSDGKQEGYVMASNEYEAKLLQQADEFLRQKKVFEEEREQYEALLDEYEVEITALEAKADRTEKENELLKELILRERQLKKMTA